MRHPLVGIVFGTAGMLVAAGLWPRPAEASNTSRASIVVRTYTQVDAESALGEARRTASGILERAGVEVAWLECGLPADATAAAQACVQPLRGNELVVRIRAAGAIDPRRDPQTLGFAYVDLDGGGGAMATVYLDRVELLAQSAGVDGAELLGRAMAHEIGHLLLGTNRHASRGLMRASWSGADLRRSAATQWLFGGGEGDLMRKGIASRLRVGGSSAE